jgi:hypothetical protein
MKRPELSQYQLIPAELTEIDSACQDDKLHNESKSDELDYTKEHVLDTGENLYIFYVNEERLNSCPRINVYIGSQSIPAVIDTGSQISLLSEELYYKSKSEGVKSLELGVQNAVLVSSFGNKSKRIPMQAKMPVDIDGMMMDHIFLISPQLLTQAILGVDFCRRNNIVINFPEQYLTMERDGKVSRHSFMYDKDVQFTSTGNLGQADHSSTAGLNCALASDSLCSDEATVNQFDYHSRKGAISKVNTVPSSEVRNNDGKYEVSERAGNSDNLYEMHNTKQLIHDRLNERGSEDILNDSREDKGRSRKLMHDYNVCTMIKHKVYEEGNVDCIKPAVVTHKSDTDDRAITEGQIHELIDEMKDLTGDQKQRLTDILIRYQGGLTKKPGKCKGFEYTFQIQGQMPKSNYSRPLPFALRPAVSEELRQLLNDDILEESHSTYLNPLTVVQRGGKSLRICVDARKINQIALPDRTKVAPMQEILQRFHGTRYITTLELSSAFLQVPLAEVSRKYTAFEFQSKVYQYKRIPYGFRNSLAGFMRALQTVLGDETCG